MCPEKVKLQQTFSSVHFRGECSRASRQQSGVSVEWCAHLAKDDLCTGVSVISPLHSACAVVVKGGRKILIGTACV